MVSRLLRHALLIGGLLIIGLYIFTDNVLFLGLFIALEAFLLLEAGVVWLRKRSED